MYHYDSLSLITEKVYLVYSADQCIFIARVAGDNAFTVVRLSVCPSVCVCVCVCVSVIAISQERINISTPNRTWYISRTISQPLLILEKFRFKMAEHGRHFEKT